MPLFYKEIKMTIGYAFMIGDRSYVMSAKQIKAFTTNGIRNMPTHGLSIQEIASSLDKITAHVYIDWRYKEIRKRVFCGHTFYELHDNYTDRDDLIAKLKNFMY